MTIDGRIGFRKRRRPADRRYCVGYISGGLICLLLDLYGFQCLRFFFLCLCRRRNCFAARCCVVVSAISGRKRVVHARVYVAVVDKATAQLYCPFPLIGRFD